MSKKTIEELEAELLRCSNESQRSQSSSSRVEALPVTAE
jgi:hypothetical protein